MNVNATTTTMRTTTMVAVSKQKAADKSDKQQRLEDIRNRQSCSMRYRKELPVSVKQAPWDKQTNA